VQLIGGGVDTPDFRYTGPESTFTSAILASGTDLLVRGINFTSATGTRASAILAKGKNLTVEGCTASDKISNFVRMEYADGVTILRCRVPTLRKHFLVADPRRSDANPENKNILIEDCYMGQSIEERAIRLQGVNGVVIRDSEFRNNNNGFKDAVCVRDGENVVIEDTVMGELTIGVMGDDNGGINMPLGPARDYELAKRLKNVRILRGEVHALSWDAITLERGVTDTIIDGTKVFLAPTVGWAVRPDGDGLYEGIRPPPVVTFRNVAVTGTYPKPIKFLGSDFGDVTVENCTVNGKLVV
jgi:hypothetical protein